MHTVCAQPAIAHKKKGADPTDTRMQCTQKRGISQSDPYRYLPCKAHLTGRPAAQTSAIFTHFLSCIRSPQLQFSVWATMTHSETKSQETTQTPWEEAEITRYRTQYRQTSSKWFQVVATSAERRSCWTVLNCTEEHKSCSRHQQETPCFSDLLHSWNNFATLYFCSTKTHRQILFFIHFKLKT